MQLNDILEENSIQAISAKTKIAEENLEYLIASEFDALSKVKTLGFISILEREYNADLSAIKTLAEEYYGQIVEGHLFPIGQPIIDDHKSKPKVLILFILLLLGVSSWYFFTQFDKKNLNGLIPFMDDQTLENFMGSDEAIKEENTLVHTLKISEETIKKNVIPPENESIKTEDNASDDIEKDDNITVENTEV